MVAKGFTSSLRRRAWEVCTVSDRTAMASRTTIMAPAPPRKARRRRVPRSTGLDGAVGTVGLSSTFKITFWNTYSDTAS